MLMKKQDPRHEVVVVDRNRAYDTFGWGVVFSDQTLGNLVAADEPTARTILQAFNHWDDIDVFFKGHKVTSRGHGFCGIGRKRLLNILQARCEALGVKLVFETTVSDERAVAANYDADLVIGCDGINSGIRARYRGVFRPQVDTRRVRFVWLGTSSASTPSRSRSRDGARLVPGAHLPVRRGNVDVHRRDAGGSLAARRASTG
jgi:anthraniloyl-CoA monooxygenase